MEEFAIFKCNHGERLAVIGSIPLAEIPGIEGKYIKLYSIDPLIYEYVDIPNKKAPDPKTEG